jgi:hypothetical protein
MTTTLAVGFQRLLTATRTATGNPAAPLPAGVPPFLHGAFLAGAVCALAVAAERGLEALRSDIQDHRDRLALYIEPPAGGDE